MELTTRTVSDGELLQRTRAGERDAFGVLYERRHELVLAFLIKRTRNPEVAMDLMAETFARASAGAPAPLPAVPRGLSTHVAVRRPRPARSRRRVRGQPARL